MFQIGEKVVYRLLTVCIVEGVETPSFEVNKDRKFYKLSPVFDNKNATTVYVPTNSNEALRALWTEVEVSKALNEVAKLKPTVCTAKKIPQLTAHYQELLRSCEPINYLLVLKETSVKEKSMKKLSEIDARFRAKTEKHVCEEFSLVLGKTFEEIRHMLNESIKV